MARITIKIKQHTPIIHFQHERPYATIRATELKPKLDRFLRSKNLGLAFNDQGSLDYKVQISSENQQIYPISRNPLYFGDMGRAESEHKRYSFVAAPVEIKFISFDLSIISAIRSSCQEFFMRTNFGTRQSKGFGSFTLDFIEKEKVSGVFPLRYRFSVRPNGSIPSRWEDLAKYIDFFYKSLRGGINLPDPFYFKSMMFLYFKEKYQRQWDKKSIKDKYFVGRLDGEFRRHPDLNGPLVFQSAKKDEEPEWLVKDLLGLSSNEKWDQDNITKEHDVTGLKNADKIERFKSPIYFKPIETATGYDVWFDADDIPDDYYGKTFKIKKNGRGDLILLTPNKNNLNKNKFDIHDYIEFAVNQDLSKHVEGRFHETWYYKEICRIYKEISDNMNLHSARKRGRISVFISSPILSINDRLTHPSSEA